MRQLHTLVLLSLMLFSLPAFAGWEVFDDGGGYVGRADHTVGSGANGTIWYDEFRAFGMSPGGRLYVVQVLAGSTSFGETWRSLSSDCSAPFVRISGTPLTEDIDQVFDGEWFNTGPSSPSTVVDLHYRRNANGSCDAVSFAGLLAYQAVPFAPREFFTKPLRLEFIEESLPPSIVGMGGVAVILSGWLCAIGWRRLR